MPRKPSNIEVACCKISLGSDKMVCCIGLYILPNQEYTYAWSNPYVLCISELHNILSFICFIYFNIVTVDNFNLQIICFYISDIINLHSLKQFISTPTRNDHILNLFLVSPTVLFDNVSITPPFSTSDHASLSCKFFYKFIKNSYHPSQLVPDFEHTDFVSFNNYTNSSNWSYIIDTRVSPFYCMVKLYFYSSTGHFFLCTTSTVQIHLL